MNIILIYDILKGCVIACTGDNYDTCRQLHTLTRILSITYPNCSTLMPFPSHWGTTPAVNSINELIDVQRYNDDLNY